MSCIKVPGPSAESSKMENIVNQVGAESKYKELIASANKVFGKEWSHAVTHTTIDFIDCIVGKYHVGCQATVKVQLSNGRYHEDVGYSNFYASTKGLAVENARSISITRALTRALSCFYEMEDEMRPNASQQNLTENISNIPKTKSAIKRPRTPPPSARSTPKFARSPLSFDRIHGMKPVIPNRAEVTNNGLQVPQENEQMDLVDIVELDLDNFDVNSNDVPAPAINAATSDFPASTSTTMTSEEIRLARIRKQREKKEEWERAEREKERQNQRPETTHKSSKF
ncbi:DNA repair and recombination protein RAD52-like [Belonocnema kinseyi]|uniref:DNA repair and recombination protein RAD52-like n=1 Tax=Belonocnema kinseyi TaxID=2817044 RepID=UPI00143CD203|nr:DNA repair and recombination protein RAD52-like [Belonocnema kinseyi]XP_033227495.1 DNA repair and recombination protein RAD52-like [Belonocnema kinseyi]